MVKPGGILSWTVNSVKCLVVCSMFCCLVLYLHNRRNADLDHIDKTAAKSRALHPRQAMHFHVCRAHSNSHTNHEQRDTSINYLPAAIFHLSEFYTFPHTVPHSSTQYQSPSNAKRFFGTYVLKWGYIISQCCLRNPFVFLVVVFCLPIVTWRMDKHMLFSPSIYNMSPC